MVKGNTDIASVLAWVFNQCGVSLALQSMSQIAGHKAFKERSITYKNGITYKKFTAIRGESC